MHVSFLSSLPVASLLTETLKKETVFLAVQYKLVTKFESQTVNVVLHLNMTKV
jgi:hypothetical protein